MNISQQNVLDLLARTMLISEESATRIRTGILHFSEEQLTKIADVLTSSVQKQQALALGAALKENPNLVQDMKKIVKEEVRTERETRETTERKQEAQDFDFDSELESVFNDTEK